MPGRAPDLELLANVLEILEENNIQGISQISCSEIARMAGCAHSYVSGVAKEHGYSFQDPSQLKNARESAHVYNKDKIINLIDKGLAQLENTLSKTQQPREMQFWFTALGIAIDKRLLLDPPKDERAERYGLSRAIQKMDERRNGGQPNKP